MTKQKPMIQPLVSSDVSHLVKWLSDPDVLNFYEGRDNPFDSQKVREVFFDPADSAQKCIFFYEDKPIGYVQYYDLDNDEKEEFGYESTQQIYGMDQFIGETAYWNRGIGTLLVQTMTRFLIEEKQADIVVMDPQAWNERALRCYEKCGFRKVKLLPKREWHEGSYRDCWLMEWKGDAYEDTAT
ncbi:aminoglycoside 6'-N-acetyltransferase [Terribacillus halophilus]|uniref:Aminoglycoside 6'-N-acetyltransferase n=1 Tax=Terribacillus halophilus TaxID=361279 RepID=A0A1G6U1L7_9BACI|nr:aminoglycoside 6'-N-acetyltransferase [Terribacillus halophilus]